MRKIGYIAWIEYQQYVVTKAFLLSLILMPVLMLSMVVVQIIGGSAQDLSDRRFIVYDPDNILSEFILEESRSYNKYDIFDKRDGLPTKQTKPRFLPEFIDTPVADLNEVEQMLSDKVKAGECFAFVIIDDSILLNDEDAEQSIVRYYSQNPTYIDLPHWINRIVNQGVKKIRFTQNNISLELVDQLSENVQFEKYSISEMTESGERKAPEAENEFLIYGLPMTIIMLLFICANMSTPLMLNTVIEEKTNKIAEVLIASVSPFQLLLGKLLGTVGVGLTLSSVYLGSAVLLLVSSGMYQHVPFSLYIWFFIFLLFTLLCFGSLWAGIGSLCSQLKDTQSFSGVAAIFIVAPLVMAPAVLSLPHAGMGRVISMIPPFTPFIMMMRLAIPPAVPLWEVLVGLFNTALFTLVSIWIGARLFRVGFLWQGQTPKLKEIGAWLRSSDD